MHRLLITGFAPFGGESTNPSWEAVSRLPDTVGDRRIDRLCLPVVFGEAAATVLAATRDNPPDAILCIGQAGGRDAITPEFVGINLRHARIPDNAGQTPTDAPILPDGPAAYFATVPARAMVAAITAAGIPAKASYSAGTYVCNDLFYTLLAHFADTPTRVGFIHVPYLPEQAKSAPAMPLETVIAGLIAAIGTL